MQETLGHSSIGLTADTYTSVSPQVAAEAAATIVPRRTVANLGVSTPLAHTPASESAVRIITGQVVGRVGFDPTP